MQLKTVGESLTAIKGIQNVFNVMSNVPNNMGKTVETVRLLKLELSSYSIETVKAAIAQGTFTAEQIKAILTAKGLTEAEIEEVITTNALAVSQTAATASTLGLGTAIKGLGASIKAFALSNPVLTVIAAIGVTIYGAVKAYDALTVSVEEANEATKEAIDSLDSLASEVENLENKISDLNEQIGKLDPITDAEDLENLRAETAELETQLAILKEKQRIASSDADKAAQKSLGMTQASRYKIEERESAYGGVEVGAAYVTKDEELLNAMEAYDEYKLKVDEANKALADMAETGQYTQNQWNEQEQIIFKYSKKMDDARSHANELADTLIEQKQGLNGSTEASQELLNTIDGTITGYNEWLNIINGTTNALEEQAQIEKKVSDETSAPLSITETIDQLNTQLKPAFDSLKSAYQDIFTTDDNGNDIFTLENVDLSMLDKIKSAIDDLNKNEELGISIDYSEFENLATVLTDASSTADDVHDAFNSFATDIIGSLNPAISKCSGENYKLIQSLLESLGIINAEAVMISSMGYSYDEYTKAKQECTDAGYDLANMTEEEINQFMLEQIESGNCGEALANLQLKKLLVNDTKIDTSSDIQQIMDLASAAGVGADVLGELAAAKSVLATVESGKYIPNDVINNVLSNVENAKQKMLDWKPAEVDFSPKNTSKSSKSGSGSSKKEKDLWLEEYKRKLKELENMRDKGKH